MNKAKSLIKNTFIIAFGTLLPKLMSIITMPILTAKLTKSEYGTYDLVETLVMLLLPIITLKIDAAGFRFIISARNDKKETSKIITNIMFVISISITISAAILLIVFRKMNPLFIIVTLIYFIADVVNECVTQIVRGLSKNKEYSIAAIINSALKTILICALLLPINLGLIGTITALLVGTLVSVIYQCTKIKIWEYINRGYVSKRKIKELLVYSWPMVPNSLSAWILRASDRLIITAFLGLEQNAVYAVANKIPNLLSTLNSTFTMAWQENASLNANDSDIEEYYTKMYDSFMRFIAGGCFLLIATTPILFKLFIHGNYEQAYYQMPILFLGIFYTCLMSFLGGIYIANKKTKSVGITTTIAAVINLAIDLLLVKKIGITAGSISTLVSYVVIVYYRMFDLKKFQNIKYNYKNIAIVNILLIVMCVLCFINNYYINIINMVIGIIFAYLLNMDIIKTITKKVISKLR